jgi:flagellar motor switch protein FliG
VLTKALGTDRATGVIDRILRGNDTGGIEALKWMDAASIAEMIRNEHPQIIATILVHLERDQAADVLTRFVERMRNDVMLRIAALEGVQPSALSELNDVLTQLMQGASKVSKSALGGTTVAAEILNNLGTSIEASVMASLREHDAELAQQIEDQMFVFENLNDLDDRGIQLLLREVQSESLIIALKGTSNDLREKIFKNMSSRAAEMLRDDFESKGPVKLSEVEAEQREILKIVRRLADEGQIALGGKGEEGLVG